MRATTFEFRYRFWVIGAIFWAGFSLYRVDPVNAGYALSVWLSAHTGWPQAVLLRLIFALAALITVAAAVLRTWACSFLHSDVVHDGALHSDRLVADGPYRYLRNPLYLGTILLAVGMGVMASRLGFAVIVLGILIFTLRLIGREEAELMASQGESYLNYRKAVPCLVPSFSPRVPEGGGRSQWMQSFQGEGFFWGFTIAMVVFAITLKVVYFWYALGIAFLLYLLNYAMLKKQSQSAFD